MKNTEIKNDEIQHYITKCNEISQGGEYTWWSRLAEILELLSSQEGYIVSGHGYTVNFTAEQLERIDRARKDMRERLYMRG